LKHKTQTCANRNPINFFRISDLFNRTIKSTDPAQKQTESAECSDSSNPYPSY